MLTERTACLVIIQYNRCDKFNLKNTEEHTVPVYDTRFINQLWNATPVDMSGHGLVVETQDHWSMGCEFDSQPPNQNY